MNVLKEVAYFLLPHSVMSFSTNVNVFTLFSDINYLVMNMQRFVSLFF